MAVTEDILPPCFSRTAVRWNQSGKSFRGCLSFGKGTILLVENERFLKWGFSMVLIYCRFMTYNSPCPQLLLPDLGKIFARKAVV